MWCPNCKEDFSDVAGADVQICPKCLAASRAGRRGRRVPKLNTSKTQSPPARRTSNQPKLRFDNAHHAAPTNVPSLVPQQTSPLVNDLRLGRRSLKHAIAFGLLVFLIGQGILFWAFLAGHFGAWSIGNLVSIIGIAVALISVSQTLGVMEQRINQLGSVAWQVTRKNKMSRKSKRKTTERIQN